MSTAISYRVGVDIGGTFTDIVCRESGGAMHVLKVPTSRGDPSAAVIQAIAELPEATLHRGMAHLQAAE